jgi:hypothetical protein
MILAQSLTMQQRGVTIAVALLLVSGVIAQTGGNYDLSWNTIDIGGGSSSGGRSPTLSSGFWNDGLVVRSVYLPMILR